MQVKLFPLSLFWRNSRKLIEQMGCISYELSWKQTKTELPHHHQKKNNLPQTNKQTQNPHKNHTPTQLSSSLLRRKRESWKCTPPAASTLILSSLAPPEGKWVKRCLPTAKCSLFPSVKFHKSLGEISLTWFYRGYLRKGAHRLKVVIKLNC